MYSTAQGGAKKIVLPVVIRRSTQERSVMMTRKLKVSKGKLISFPDKREWILNFKRWPGLHLCGSQWCMVLITLQASSSPGKHSLNTQTMLDTYLYAFVCTVICFSAVLTIIITYLCICWPKSLLPYSIMRP